MASKVEFPKSLWLVLYHRLFSICCWSAPAANYTTNRCSNRVWLSSTNKNHILAYSSMEPQLKFSSVGISDEIGHLDVCKSSGVDNQRLPNLELTHLELWEILPVLGLMTKAWMIYERPRYRHCLAEQRDEVCQHDTYMEVTISSEVCYWKSSPMTFIGAEPYQDRQKLLRSYQGLQAENE